MNINEFTSVINALGFQHGNKFQMLIPSNGALQPGEKPVSAEILAFLCESATFPGYDASMDNIAVSSRHFTVADKYQPFQLDLKFIVDENMFVRDFFESWKQKIYVDAWKVTGTSQQRGIFLNFPDEYTAAACVLNILNASSEIVKSVVFERVWPTRVGNIEFSWSGNDRYAVMDVTLNYFEYRIA
jgi:hypothetical protein